MVFQLKEKNKLLTKNINNFNTFKSFLSKAKYVAKNVIYVRNWSDVDNKIFSKSNLFKNESRINIEFCYGTYLVKIIKNNDPLMANVKKLRFNSFFDESQVNAVDTDEFDELCDHLVVIDQSISNDYIVGTYRLLFRSSNNLNKTFYSQSEFDISNLLNKNVSLLEAGRSCVRKEYRDGRIIKLLWRALATYIIRSKVGYIFGCASFPSSNHKQFSKQLSYLHHNHNPSKNLETYPLKSLRANFEIYNKDQLNNECEFRSLPPLIKAYLRVGAYVGRGAVIDQIFNTTDVLIILDTKKLIKKYSNLSLKD